MSFPTVLLYSFSILGSGIGFVAQSLIAGFWVTTFSNDVLYFSLVTAFYFLSLGVGSLLSSYWKRPTLATLLWLTLALSLLAGFSIPLLKIVIGSFGNFFPAALLLVCFLGTLSGQLIPLTLRIGRNHPSLSLSTLFFCDYLAAIVFTVAFTLFCLIPHGYGNTVRYLAITGTLACLLVAWRGKLLRMSWFATASIGIAGLYFLPNPSPSPGVIHSEQSHYQKIVLTEETGTNPLFPSIAKHTLYLDGFIQFSSVSEQNYHACLVNVPLAAAEFAGQPVRHALVLGGGDGLVARNLLTSPKIKQITQVEIDPAMIRLAQSELKVRMYNLDSLRSPRVKIEVEDAFRWVRDTKSTFDVVIIDFPAPKNLTLSRLFTAEFYRQVFRLLSPKGVIAIQAGPSFAAEDQSLQTLSKVSTSIKRTLMSLGKPAHVYVNTRDNEAFILASQDPSFDGAAFFKKAGMYADKSEVVHLCIHSPRWIEPAARINTLNTLTLSTYMLSWFDTIGGEFFDYRGGHAVFLPN